MDNQNYQPQPPMQQPSKNGKNLAVASLVCGIIGVVCACLMAITGFVFIALVLSILGIVLGAKSRGIEKTGMATAGLVLGIIGTVFSGVLVVCVICGAGILGAAVLSSV